MTAPGWMIEAACAGRPQSLFFAEHGGDDYAAGKTICADCPVRLECLSFAKREGIQDGLWGGLSPAERTGRSSRDLRRATPRWCVVCGTGIRDCGHGPVPATCSVACRDRASWRRRIGKPLNAPFPVVGGVD